MLDRAIQIQRVGCPMSQVDIRALEANFEAWRKERVPELPTDKAFERFAIDQVLKDSELGDEEITSGIIAGKDDGGVDGMYLFMNRTLIQEKTVVLPDPTLKVDLVLVQAKFEKGFGETPVEKLHSFTRDLLDYSKPVENFTYVNQDARDAMTLFREKYEEVIGSSHELTVTYHYATKSDQEPNLKVVARIDNLIKFVNTQLSAAVVRFESWGCQRLLAAARRPPRKEWPLDIEKHLITDDKSAVCLVNLKSYAKFLTDDRGEIRRHFLEPNVRDYQGRQNPVNTDIRKSLGNPETGDDFWWLNNGITILAREAPLAGNKLTIHEPEIVNGLQTSQEVFDFFKANPDKTENRRLLVRIIIPPKPESRNRIIKATNFQTTVNAVSLHAADPIHMDIEELFVLYGLYYDRRKGEYKTLRKPVARIVSARDLARTVIAVVLRRPDDARARPQTLLNEDTTYTEVFNDKFDRKLFIVCMLLMRQVDKYLQSLGDLQSDTRTDIRYYVVLALACELAGAAAPSPAKIAALEPLAVSPVADTIVDPIYRLVLAMYKSLGGTDRVAKGKDFAEKLRSELATRLSVAQA
jgi:hypothetical protein